MIQPLPIFPPFYKALLLCLALLSLPPDSFAAVVQVQSGKNHWQIDPSTLELSTQSDSGPRSVVSTGVADAGKCGHLASLNDGSVHWEWPERQLSFEVHPVDAGGIEVRMVTTTPQTLQWPGTPPMNRETELVWPLGNGIQVSAADKFWQNELIRQEWDAAEAMSLPAFGRIHQNQTYTWLTATAFRDTLTFETSNSALLLTNTHSFSSHAPSMTTVYRFYVDDHADPLAPARHYRQYMQEKDSWKSLEQKAAQTSSVLLLKGAPHIYLWGGMPVSTDDIKDDQWQTLCQDLVKNETTSGTAASRLRSSFTPAQWKAVTEAAGLKRPYKYVKEEVAAGLSSALLSSSFTNPDSSEKTTPAAVIAGNSKALFAAYPNTFHPIEDWGGGISVRMLKQLEGAGLHQARLCTDGNAALALRPHVAELARQQGLLIGTYDSYHSVHPVGISQNDTWPTAQMTEEIYTSGSVIDKDGKPLAGFKGVGRKVNSIAVRDFAHARIKKNFLEVPYNYYFMDCDGTGEFFDDFSPAHPTSKEADAAERMARLYWISKTFGAVTGSEGGHAYSVPYLAVAEGVAGPFFGWDEPLMKDPKSSYYRGRYWPSEAPDVYFKPVLLMERFKKKFYDPAVRIPLYQAAFHDAIVTVPHWSNGFFKYPEVQAVTALTNLLYLTPPLYHLDQDELKRRKEEIAGFYQVWSPLHANYGFAPLASFRHLSEDRLVQEARYGDDCRIIVNFSTEKTHVIDGLSIRPLTAAILFLKTGKAPLYYTAPSPNLPGKQK